MANFSKTSNRSRLAAAKEVGSDELYTALNYFDFAAIQNPAGKPTFLEPCRDPSNYLATRPLTALARALYVMRSVASAGKRSLTRDLRRASSSAAIAAVFGPTFGPMRIVVQ